MNSEEIEKFAIEVMKDNNWSYHELLDVRILDEIWLDFMFDIGVLRERPKVLWEVRFQTLEPSVDYYETHSIFSVLINPHTREFGFYS